MTMTMMMCPFCKDWQIDFTDETLTTYLPPLIPPSAALGLFHALIDDLLFDHALDCFGVPS